MSKFKQIVYLRAFWKSVLGLALAFIVVYNLIMVIFDGFTFQPLIDKATYQPVRFFIANIVSGVFYGLIISYFQFRKKMKDLER